MPRPLWNFSKNPSVLVASPMVIGRLQLKAQNGCSELSFIHKMASLAFAVGWAWAFIWHTYKVNGSIITFTLFCLERLHMQWRKMNWLNVGYRLGLRCSLTWEKILKIRSGLFIFVGLISNRSYLRFVVCHCSQTVPKDPSLHFQPIEIKQLF